MAPGKATDVKALESIRASLQAAEVGIDN